MWEIVLESIVPALLLGVFATIISVVLTNKFSLKKEKREKQYILLSEIYNVLYEEYKNLDGRMESEWDEVGTTNYFTDALIAVYRDSETKLKSIQKSLQKIRFAYTIEELAVLDSKIEDVENQYKKLYFTALRNKIQDKGDEDKIIIREGIDCYDDDDFQKYMRIFIDNTQLLYNEYMQFIENKLRSLIQ